MRAGAAWATGDWMVGTIGIELVPQERFPTASREAWRRVRDVGSAKEGRGRRLRFRLRALCPEDWLRCSWESWASAGGGGGFQEAHAIIRSSE